ncbi:MAG: ATP-dependent chaperone ClpB [Nitriliruptoraceae bacterium]
MDRLPFTTRASAALGLAEQDARQAGHPEVAPAHLLVALLADADGLPVAVLGAAAIDVTTLADELTRITSAYPVVTGTTTTTPFARPISDVVVAASDYAKTVNDRYVSTDHLLWAISQCESDAQRALHALGATTDVLTAAIAKVRKGQTVDTDDPEATIDPLEKYAKDLTAMARDGKLDPVIGRDEEIRRTIQVLVRRTKNNPVLIGEPGVGKTAIVEGLARRIVEGDVPTVLADKRVVELDLSAMVAGAKYRGEFEERLKAVLKAIQDAQGGIITFIDELHTMIGAGGAEGAMDAANMLKPMLARGELHMIGATTLTEYRSIEKDAALERRFQPVHVAEPSVPDTIGILRGLRERYEVHHGVRITDDAIVAAATLSDRYLTDRFLPDKAIDLMDESMARLRIAIDSLPPEIDEVDRRMRQLQIERVSVAKDDTDSARTRLADLDAELATLSATDAALRQRWEREKALIDALRRTKEQLEQLRDQADQAERDGDFTKASELRYGQIPELEQTQKNTQEAIEELRASGESLLEEEVGEQDIAEVVGRWTGIPAAKLIASEASKLANLDEALHARVIGQDVAVRAVANAVRRARAGISDPDRPLGSFLFLGPTGVGKTELARALAQFLFDDERAMVRIDMGEFQEKHTVSRLIGAPPGYVGYDEGGQLTEAVRRRPYRVVLLDEVEKAHPDVFNVLLQLLDDGRLTDGQGRTVDFRNVVVIMTSNLGSSHILDPALNTDQIAASVLDDVRSQFKPEFLNRIDELVIFERLTRDELRQIVDIQLQRLVKRLAEQEVTLVVADAVRDHLAAVGYDPLYGARPLKRAIQKELEDLLASALVNGTIQSGMTATIDRATDGTLEVITS